MPSPPTKWLDAPESKPAPGSLGTVQALVNTVDRESGADRLAAADDAATWLSAHGLLPQSAHVSGADLRQLTDVREALRALLIHNAGGPHPTASALGVLRELAEDTSARLALDDSGTFDVGPVGGSLRAGLLGLLLVIRDAQRDGTWCHLKACANDACQWAFYDRSRNHGGMWCDMAACGNKLKNRDFRARQRKADSD